MKTQLLDWREPHTPVSKEYDDIYYASENGLSESRYVFLENNQLPDRWLEKESHQIGELGFGTGLNFLASAELFLRTNSKGQLHFTSLERTPLALEDIQRALTVWPELERLSLEFLDAYPALVDEGRVSLFDKRIHLQVVWEEAETAIESFPAMVETWFLDGFAPKKNPAMWSENLIAKLAKHSAKDAHFATYASAGSVRRALQSVGFVVSKEKGFGNKREMLRGHL